MGWQQLPSMIKFGVNDVISCWAGSIGINSRSFAREISKIYLERHGVLSFLEFVEWIMNLPNEFVIREMVGNIFEKRRFLQARSRLITNRDLLNHINSQSTTMIAEVRGLYYENRQQFVDTIVEGDLLTLEVEIDNEFDPYAVQVFFNENHIGYIQRISRELQIGHLAIATVRHIERSTQDSQVVSIQLNVQLTEY